MRKASIYTLNGNINYGNKLQNYAIIKILESFNYHSYTIWFDYSIKRRIKMIIKYLFPIKLKYIRERRFEKFTRKFLNRKFHKVTSHKYIVGSDQVWNCNFKSFNNSYFLPFSNAENNIAFSASFGIDEIDKKYYDPYRNGLNNIKYISVREKTGKKIVKNITGRDDVVVMLDPTMILPRVEWEKIIKKPKKFPKKKYILNYFLGNLSKDKLDKINKFAEDNNCIIINLLNPKDSFYCSDPQEFLYLEKNAFMIFTDSFHACVFAIVFERKFLVFRREDNKASMYSRINTLLSKFNLDNNYYENKDIKIPEMDYEKINKLLENEREKALDFISNALK